MTHLMFTQNIKPTDYQNNRIKEIFTPEYIIETSRVISIKIEQDSVIKVRDIQIKDRDSKIEKLKNEYKDLIKKLEDNTDVLQEVVREENEIVESIIKNRSFKNNIHLYTSVKFNLINNIILEPELLYEFKKVHVGVSSELIPNSINYKVSLNFKLRYKIF